MNGFKSVVNNELSVLEDSFLDVRQSSVVLVESELLDGFVVGLSIVGILLKILIEGANLGNVESILLPISLALRDSVVVEARMEVRLILVRRVRKNLREASIGDSLCDLFRKLESVHGILGTSILHKELAISADQEVKQVVRSEGAG